MRRILPTVLCTCLALLAFAALHGSPSAPAATQSTARYEVTMQIGSTYSSGPFGHCLGHRRRGAQRA